MSADAKAVGEAGALPTLDAKPVLGPPKVATKAKSNVSKLFYLLAGLAAFVFIVAGLIVFARSRASAPKPEVVGGIVTPATSKRNSRVENQSIDQFKAHLKEKDVQAAAIAARQASAAAAAAAASSAAGGTGGAAGLAAYDRPAAPQGGAGQGGPGQPGQAGGQRNGAGAAAAPAVAASKPLTAEERAMSGDVAMALPGDATAGRRGAGQGDGPGVAAAAPAQESNDSFAASLKPTVFAAGRAGHPAGSMNYLLEQRTAIPCALEGGIDTTLPGPVVCQVIEDVYSANGVTKLVDRGAHVFGEQRSALKDGQHVTAVIWDRIHSGDVWIDVDSPGTDQMGYNGVPVDVDNHWSERVGAALMLSFINDYADAMAAKQSQSSGSGPTYNQTTQTGQSLAGKVLDHSINIPPTGTQKPGKVVYIRMVRDVSFENVYALQR